MEEGRRKAKEDEEKGDEETPCGRRVLSSTFLAARLQRRAKGKKEQDLWRAAIRAKQKENKN